MTDNIAHPTATTDTITILMATYNGARFIDAQLDSLAAQTHEDWALWISDDGSTDGTVDQVRTFAAAHPNRDIQVFKGPQRGPAQNFFSLLTRPNLPSGAIAFADQDDVWLPHKLAQASAQISAAPSSRAVGYVCTDIATDENLHPFHRQKRRIKYASFRNALVQNVMRGNAIVLNRQAVEIIRAALSGNATAKQIKFHDWWIYLVLSGVGANIIVNPEPGLFYRQHGENALGANIGIGGIIKRLKLLRSLTHQDWITGNLEALDGAKLVLSPENTRRLAQFKTARLHAGGRSMFAFLRSGARWQTRRGTAIMALQALLGRL